MSIQYDDNPSMNAASVARFEDISIPTLNRRIREGDFPSADYLVGPLRYWLRSTVIAAREQRIAKSKKQAAKFHAKQIREAKRARDARDRKREERNTNQEAV